MDWGTYLTTSEDVIYGTIDGRGSGYRGDDLLFEIHYNLGEVQRFRVRHGLSCVNGPFWPVRAGCYSQAALSLPHSKPLYKVLLALAQYR